MKVVAAPPPPPAVFLRSYLLARLLLVNNVQTQPRLTREVLQLFCQSDKERKTTMQLVDATLSTPGEPYIMHEGRVFQKRLRDALLSALHCRENPNPLASKHFFPLSWENWERTHASTKFSSKLFPVGLTGGVRGFYEESAGS